MLTKNSKIVCFLFMLVSIVKITKSSKCGEFFCDYKSECKYNPEKLELNCVCDEGYIRHVKEKDVFCVLDNEEKCLRVGAKCGPYHECNRDLICEEIDDQNVEIIEVESQDLVCHAEEQKCARKCCHVNEICQDGKICIVREKEIQVPDVGFKCSEHLICGNECCAQHEVCSKINVCVSKETLDIGQEIEESLCVDSRQCLDKCCKENEICQNGEKCVLKEKEFADCQEGQKCQNKCCTLNEICQNDIQCVSKDAVLKECPEQQFCHDKCCAENETCNKENKCVAKEKLNEVLNEPFGIVLPLHPESTDCPESQQCLEKCCNINEKCENGGECISNEPFISECPDVLQCHNKCCNENEVCSNAHECVSKETFNLQCPEAQKCEDKCCSLKQICSKDLECVDELTLTTPLNDGITGSLDCPLPQQCQGKCCSQHEKCNEVYECISIAYLDCLEIDKCANKCCPVNETCNEENECVPYIEVITLIENCPPKQKCQNVCCSPQEVCSDLKECVNKNLVENSNLYNFPKEDTVITKTQDINDFDAVIPIYDIDNIKENIRCPNDHEPCQDKCCNAEEICNTIGQCINKIKSIDCDLGEHCVENASVTNNKTSLAYTMIGLGSLVGVFSIGLFKVYDIRRTNRNVF